MPNERSNEQNDKLAETNLDANLDANLDDELDVGTLAERFSAEFRAGKRPSVEEYATRCPQFAEEIRELFPALELLERGGSQSELSSLSQGASRQGFALENLERLKNYRIVREIGRGGMGVVYEAWDETLERPVALKVMKIFPGEETQAIARFQREAKTAARLHHTNIVPVYGSDVIDDKFYYAMQLIDGVTLEEFLRLKEKEASETFEAARSSKLFNPFKSTKSARTSVSNEISRSTEIVPPDLLAETQPLPTDFYPNRRRDPASEETQLSPETSEPLKSSKAPQTLKSPKASQTPRRSKPRRVSPSAFCDQLPASNKPLTSVHIAGSDYYRRVCDVGAQAAQGLDYAHRHGVVHRDVKPSNLIVDDDGVVWIADFGLAKQIDETRDLTRQGQLVGTLRYLSPEGLEGNFSPLSDVYSLGLTLYELLTFSPAYDESSYSKLFAQVASGEFVRPRRLNPSVPLDLETIVLKATEKSPEKRYATAGELADDLQRFLDDRPIRARRVGPIGRVWRWCKRNRLVAGLLCSIILLISLIFAGTVDGYVESQKLLRAKRAESDRAQRNLDLALAAFDDVFESLGDGADVNFNFLSDAASFIEPPDEPSIAEKDARVLERLLRFYDGFAQANKNEPALLFKSARAYVKTGNIQKLLGRSNESDAYSKALEFFDRGLELAQISPEERERVALEKAAVVLAAFGDVGARDPKADRFFPLCQTSLDELAAIRPDSSFVPLGRRFAACLRLQRAALKLEIVRRGENANASADVERGGFFDVVRGKRPNERDAAAIQADFDAVSAYLDEISRDAEVAETPDSLLIFNRFYALYSRWQTTLGNVAEARRAQERGQSSARTFALLCPGDSRAYFATILQNAFKTLVDDELRLVEGRPADADARAELAKTEEAALDAANELVEKFPNSAQYAVFHIIVRFHFAKREAILGNLDRSETLLREADAAMRDFCKTRPNYDDFKFFGPIHAGFAELTIAEKRYSEAEEQIAKLETVLQTDVEASTPERRERLRGEVERLRNLLAQSRAEDAAANDVDSSGGDAND